MAQPRLLMNFVGTAAATALYSAALVLAVSKSSRAQHNVNYEIKFRALKYGRTGTYALLAACQAALVLWHAAEHWPELAWDVDGSQSLVLAVYVFTLAVLCIKWRQQLSLQLSGVLLVALLEPGLLFWQDITGVRPDGSLDAEHVARVVLHCVQFVLLLALLVAEVVIQQHQLLQKSTFGSSSGGSGTLPVTLSLNGGNAYQRLPGTAAEAADKQQHNKQGLPQQQPQQQPFKAWRPGDGRLRMAASAFHYVWPAEGTLKLRLMLCLLLVLSERVINLAAPIAFKNMVEVLSAAAASSSTDPIDGQQQHPLVHGLRHLLMAATGTGLSIQTQQQQQQPSGAPAMWGASSLNSTHPLPAAAAAAPGWLQDVVGLAPFWTLFYPWVFVYLGAFFLRGGSGSEGLLANVRDILWIPITQAAFRRISNDVFGHLLELDLNFHVHRKTGQIMRILDRGTSSIQDTVSIILFNVMPQLIDILVACTYLASALKGPWVALIVLFTVGSYVPLTLVITEQRGKVRKVMNALDNERESRATDMLLNYETIKYFCAEGPELNGFDTATRKYQMAFLSLLSLVQSLVVWLGLAAGLVFCIWGSSRGRVSVGDTVLFISMMQQLYVPLTFFGSYYRQVTKALIDMENMFELLATKPRVQDEPNAAMLQVSNGTVEFKQVVFSYSPSPTVPPVLRGLSFLAPGGRSVAVVGSTGSGKSTLLRLLLRFYDPQSGCVCIDGQDIRHCTQTSVRGAIGVVPQDCVLFNDTIMYNIRYGRPEASDGQVHEAAQVSHIHDHLMRFPQGYSTRVGERGLRLSGGEKQRVAFARAVLKAPAIMVLDEATSSLDSLTERLIQDSLAAIRGTCTQVIVAHRLSTIMDADQILVLAKGQVVESGSHSALVAAGGLYASMWARQQDSSSSCAPSPAPKAKQDSSRGKHAPPAGSAGGTVIIGSSSRPSDADDEDGSSDNDSSKPNGSTTTGPGMSDALRKSAHAQQQQRQHQHQEQRQHGEVQEGPAEHDAASGGLHSTEPPGGSVAGLQSPPPVLPPLPRPQRRLPMQHESGTPHSPHRQRGGGGDGGGGGANAPSGSGGASTSSRQRVAATAAAGSAAVQSGQDDGGGAAAGREGAGDDGAPAPTAAGGGPVRVRSARRCNSSCGHGRHANFWSREQVDDQSELDDDQQDDEEEAEQQQQQQRHSDTHE